MQVNLGITLQYNVQYSIKIYILRTATFLLVY